MPPCTVRVFKMSEEEVPFREWLLTLTLPSKSQNLLAAARIRAIVQALSVHGHALRRPASAPLRDEIHELRVRLKRVHYRVLYFFDGPGIAILALGCTKEGAVAQADIDRAVRYRSMYLSAPAHHVVQPSVPR